MAHATLTSHILSALNPSPAKSPIREDAISFGRAKNRACPSLRKTRFVHGLLFSLLCLQDACRVCALGFTTRRLQNYVCETQGQQNIFVGINTTVQGAAMSWRITEIGKDPDDPANALVKSEELPPPNDQEYEDSEVYIVPICLTEGVDAYTLSMSLDAEKAKDADAGWAGGYVTVRDDDCNLLGGGAVMGTVPAGQITNSFSFELFSRQLPLSTLPTSSPPLLLLPPPPSLLAPPPPPVLRPSTLFLSSLMGFPLPSPRLCFPLNYAPSSPFHRPMAVPSSVPLLPHTLPPLLPAVASTSPHSSRELRRRLLYFAVPQTFYGLPAQPNLELIQQQADLSHGLPTETNHVSVQQADLFYGLSAATNLESMQQADLFYGLPIEANPASAQQADLFYGLATEPTPKPTQPFDLFYGMPSPPPYSPFIIPIYHLSTLPVLPPPHHHLTLCRPLPNSSISLPCLTTYSSSPRHSEPPPQSALECPHFFHGEPTFDIVTVSVLFTDGQLDDASSSTFEADFQTQRMAGGGAVGERTEEHKGAIGSLPGTTEY
ncbi:hypothetical protein CYMTET_46360 [Cymbomonas tetramitiformis]|uniref:Uncharacterized protein n=1 Tax=Cymbomonas tetramitiformis TaxID=36881 RepID=A0AAE0EXN9_9CHLO|nr:hypothetical protein CYMTET_46360 [Cymbomonas tetramitiformis]